MEYGSEDAQAAFGGDETSFHLGARVQHFFNASIPLP